MSEQNEKTYQAIELAKSTGKLKKGTNEVTKAIDKGQAKLVAIASDINPKEIVMHMPILCKEKGIPCIEVSSKDELGAAAGIPVGTASVAIVKEGESKEIIAELKKETKE